MSNVAGVSRAELDAALDRVERTLAADRTLDDYLDYQAVRLVAGAADELLATERLHSGQVAALEATILQLTGWLHAYNTGEAEAGEASLYLDSLPDRLLPNEAFSAAKVKALQALSLQPLLALGVSQTDALGRAWDLLAAQHPSVMGGLLLRLEPKAVSILFRLALEANDWRHHLELAVAEGPDQLEGLLATGTVSQMLGRRDEEGHFTLVLLAIDADDGYRFVAVVGEAALAHYQTRWAPHQPPVSELLEADPSRFDP